MSTTWASRVTAVRVKKSISGVVKQVAEVSKQLPASSSSASDCPSLIFHTLSARSFVSPVAAITIALSQAGKITKLVLALAIVFNLPVVIAHLVVLCTP